MPIVQVRLICLMALAGLLASTEFNVGGIVALTIATLCVAVALSRVPSSMPAVSGAGPIRRARAAGPVYSRQTHPDAAGHPRPRAPGNRLTV